MLSDAQLACAAVAAAPILIGALWALGDLVGHMAAQDTPPSPARVARLAVGFVPVTALFVIAELGGLADTACLRLRDWMDV